MVRALTTRDLALCALIAAMTAAGSFVSFPLYAGVPFTLQVLFVLLAGLVLGSRLAVLSMVVYVLVGLIAPVYAGGGSGFGHLVGPWGGYIWGFVIGAGLVGVLAERLRPHSLAGLVAVGLAGIVPIYLLGCVWLAAQIQSPSFHTVAWAGALQFIPGDVLKAVVAGLAARALAATPLRLPALSRQR